MNRVRNLTILLMAPILSGCMLDVLTSTAVVSTLQAEQMESVSGAMQHAGETMGAVQVQRAVDTYHAEKGAYPPSLDVLAPDFLPSVPVKPDGSPYAYDPVTGRVHDGAAGTGAQAVTASDQQKMQQIYQAIRAYGARRGVPPPSLEALTPNYLLEVPRTDSGQLFLYDPRTGAVAHPAQLGQRGTAGAYPQPPQARQPAAYGAGGPMTETMTGIGMQQELNRMSNAGSSSMGSYGRQRVGDIQTQQNQRHEQALDALGF